MIPENSSPSGASDSTVPTNLPSSSAPSSPIVPAVVLSIKDPASSSSDINGEDDGNPSPSSSGSSDSSSTSLTPEEPDPRKLRPSDEAASVQWRAYKTNGKDRSDNLIERVYAKDDDYVIYFIDGDLYYECTAQLLKDTAMPDVALAKINRLLPSQQWTTPAVKWRKRQTLELAADALEMCFCGHGNEGTKVLEDLVTKLETTRAGTHRLWYQGAAVLAAAGLWSVYLPLYHCGLLPKGWEPWILAAALGSAGGVFSVCLNFASVQVNVSHPLLFLICAGATRVVIAILGGIACLLAMRAKVILGLAAGETAFDGKTALVMTEMFFCFLAGFSETFVSNVLSKAEQDAKAGAPPASSSANGSSSSPGST